jgi:ubiquinone/menaquinone biosynthesis C-methylase UbiE
MDLRQEHDSKTLAEQLRLPAGLLGIKVGENMNKGNRLMNLESIRQLEVSDNDNILEIGMGNGFFVKDIISLANNVHYTGCDFSATMVSEATALNRSYASNAKFELTAAENLPFSNAVFDKVFTVNTIYFWDNAAITLAEIRRVLKPNGILIVTLRPKSVMDKLPVVEYGFSTFSKESAVQLITENNFEIVSASESDDVDIKMNDQFVKNAFLVIKAKRK